jgi:hypothetical protein
VAEKLQNCSRKDDNKLFSLEAEQCENFVVTKVACCSILSKVKFVASLLGYSLLHALLEKFPKSLHMNKSTNTELAYLCNQFLHCFQIESALHIF